jgi:Flp pilus assembly protein TadG
MQKEDEMMLKRLRNCRGAAALEFAIVVPVFLLLVFAIIDFGWYFFVQHTIQLATSEGARLGAVREADGVIIQEIKDRASIAVKPEDLDIAITIPDPPNDPNIKQVKTTYSYNLSSINLLGFLIDKNIQAEVTYKIEPVPYT